MNRNVSPVLPDPPLPFSHPRHPPRAVPANLLRAPSQVHPQALLPNVDVGDSLHTLLNSDDDGKQYSLVDPGIQSTGEVWRSQVLRFYFQNVNGLKLAENGNDILDAFYHMETIRADVFGFAETKLDCRISSTQSLLHRLKQKVWGHCKLSSCSSILPWHSSNKPGGVLLGVTGPLVGRVKFSFNDDLGRWVGLELLGRNGRPLVIICAYQVCQKSGRSGDFTAYTQQVSILRRRGVDRPNPRKQFITDLIALLKPYCSANADIVLMGDFNESIGLGATGMTRVIQECHLTDAQAYRHGLDTEQSTYARGPNRVDYFLVSERLLPFIKRQGCEPFNARIFSDHRGLFLDMSYPGFFDRSPNILSPPSRRNLIYNCPRQVRKYLEYMAKYIEDHKLLERAGQIATETRSDSAAESFDHDFTIGLLAADIQCKSFRRSPWSRKLHEAMTAKHIHSRQLSSLLTGRDMTDQITHLQSSLSNPVPVSGSLPITRHLLRQAQHACRLVVIQARDLAKEHQDTRIVAKQLANPDSDPEQMAKLIRSRDATREMWRRIPSSRPHSTGGISMIKVPTIPTADPKHPDTVFRTVVDPEEMESLLVARNRDHFKQAEHTPLASHHLSTALGWGGTSTISDNILTGSSDLAALTDDHYARDILAACQRLNEELDPSITLEQLQQFYLHWRVGTSTSPSGRHLSHVHALFQPIGQTNDSKETSAHFHDIKESLWSLHYAAVHYATKYGYCFSRWRNVVNTLIEKEPGNPAIHRLRVIHLYENDYNLILGTKFREVIRHCQDKGQLNPGCYGGLTTKQSLDPVFLELMQYDYAMLTRCDAIKFANDASSCYDRIVVSPSNVIARSRGLHSNIAQLHGSMLEHATYRIKTQLGISQSGYSHSFTSPVFGTGQGSCSSPPIWNLNGSLYFDVFDAHCHGAEYCDLDESILLKLGMTGFVDDNSVQSNCHPLLRPSLIGKATHDAQLWSDILWSSGGALELDKCSYHYLRTDFDKHGAPILRTGRHGEPIVISDPHGRSTTLKQLSVYSPYKTLGTQQCPGSAQRSQSSVLIKKAQSLVRTLATSSCHGHPAWMFYSSVFCKSVGYPLAVSRLSTKQLLQIQGPMIPVILNRLGYERRLAHSLAFGPRSHGGLGLTHLKTTKLTSQISLLMRQLRTPGQPCTLTRINLNRLQYTAGVSFPVLEYPSRRLPHLEGTWLPHFRSSLVDLDASLEISDIRILPLQRHHDSYIMEIALSATNPFTDREIRYINYCRFYFKSLSISDLCTACGKKIAPGVSSGAVNRHQSVSFLHEPYQEDPGPDAWRAWRKFLRIISDSTGTLHHALGPWLHRPTALRRRWPFLYSPSKQWAFKWRTSGYSKLGYKRPRVYTFRCFGSTMDLPDDCVPVDMDVIDDGYRLRQYGAVDSPPALIDLSTLSFSEYLDRQQDHERCALLRFDTFGVDIHDIMSALKPGLDEIILVSDGGAAHKCGSFGWSLGTSSGRRLAQGSGTVFGYDPMSYRAEISGCRAGLLFILHASVYCSKSIPHGTLQVYCDNSGFIKKIAKYRSFELALCAGNLDAEWDLLVSVMQLLSLFPDPPKVQHIKGHQDRHKCYDDLNLIAQMNVDADKLATIELAEFGTIQSAVPFDPVCQVLLHIGGRAVTRAIETAVRNKFFLQPLLSFYNTRFQWSPTTQANIDWDAYSTAYSSYPRSRKFFYQFGWKKLPCGGRLHFRQPSYDDRCPSCHQPDESDDHLFQCRHSDRLQWRKHFLRGILAKLTPLLDPDLLDMIRLGLQGYFNADSTVLQSRFPDPVDPSGTDPDDSSIPSSSIYSFTSVNPLLCQPCASVGSSSTNDHFPFFSDTDSDDSDFDPNASHFTALSPTTPPQSSNPIIQLRQAQDLIGWDHFLRGKMDSEWSRLQYKYASQFNLVEASKNWQQWLIKYMATQSYNLWCSRNRLRHGTDIASSCQSKLIQARRDVSALYALQDNVLPQDRDLFCASLEIHLLQPVSQLLNWLSVNKDLIHLSIRTAIAQSKARTRPIKSFFRPLAPPRRSVILQPKQPALSRSLAVTRLTRFFATTSRQTLSTSAPPGRHPVSATTIPRPRQRYLLDFFPNHPG